MSALFGWLHLDGRRRAERSTAERIAASLGAASLEVRVDRGLSLAVARDRVDPDVEARARAKRAGESACLEERTTELVASADGSRWLAFDGAIENGAALLRERERVRQVHLPSPAAIALELVCTRGAEAAARALEGFFRFAVWDAHAEELRLRCDRRGGVAPLYLYRDARLLVFGSSLKAVAAHPEVERRLDPDALAELFLLGQSISPRTALARVTVLATGACLVCRGRSIHIEEDAAPSEATGAPAQVTPAELAQRYFHALQGAVARAIDTPRSIGVLSSGGVDSAAIVALMRRAGCERIRTFSIHLGDGEAGDRRGALEVAERFATEHRSIDGLDARCLDVLPEILWQIEEPAQDVHPTYWLCREAAREVEVVLAGYGNDLVWGGPLPRLRSLGWRGLLPRLRAERQFVARHRRIALAELARLLPSATSSEEVLVERLGKVGSGLHAAQDRFVTLDEIVYGEAAVMREVGKFAVEAHGLSPRLPYFDERVAAVANAVPAHLATGMGPRGRELKHFFKDVLRREDLLPEEMIGRRKRWMTSPTAAWLRGDLGKRIEPILLGEPARWRGLFDCAEVERRLREHRTGARDSAFVLMMLVAVELWQRIFIDPPVVQRPAFTLSEAASLGRCRPRVTAPAARGRARR